MGIEADDNLVVITHPSNAKTQVKVLNYGATVISWQVDGIDQLWLSEAAKLDGSRAVRGGIPLVFPVFGKSSKNGFKDMPQHGFARNSTWEFLGQTNENPPSAQFALSPDEANKDIYSNWGSGDHDFRLFLTVELGDKYLKTKIEVQNVDTKPWDFNWLFHTYLKVDDIEDTLVSNLPGEQCYDQLLKEDYVEKSPAVQFHQEVDRIYKKVSQDKTTQVIHLGKAVHTVRRENLPDIVVWNPWIDKSGGMADFQPKNGYKNMVCIEPGYVSEFVTLKPEEIWTASQTISIGNDIHLQAV